MEPAEGGASGKDGTGLRLARQARGFSQQQLAGMAGVSRQLVAAVESGRSVASLRVGLAFARALGLSVGELFGSVTPSPPVSAQPVAPVGEAGFRVALAPIGDTFVALPLTGTAAYRTGFAPASGLMTGADASRSQPVDAQPCSSGRGSARPIRLVRPIGVPRPALVVAGDDPALPLLEVPLGLLDPPLGLAWWPGGTKAALRLAAKGLVHAAAVCVRETSGERRTGPGAPFVRREPRWSRSAPGARAWCCGRSRPPVSRASPICTVRGCGW